MTHESKIISLSSDDSKGVPEARLRIRIDWKPDSHPDEAWTHEEKRNAKRKSRRQFSPPHRIIPMISRTAPPPSATDAITSVYLHHSSDSSPPHRHGRSHGNSENDTAPESTKSPLDARERHEVFEEASCGRFTHQEQKPTPESSRRPVSSPNPNSGGLQDPSFDSPHPPSAPPGNSTRPPRMVGVRASAGVAFGQSPPHQQHHQPKYQMFISQRETSNHLKKPVLSQTSSFSSQGPLDPRALPSIHQHQHHHTAATDVEKTETEKGKVHTPRKRMDERRVAVSLLQNTDDSSDGNNVHGGRLPQSTTPKRSPRNKLPTPRKSPQPPPSLHLPIARHIQKQTDGPPTTTNDQPQTARSPVLQVPSSSSPPRRGSISHRGRRGSEMVRIGGGGLVPATQLRTHHPIPGSGTVLFLNPPLDQMLAFEYSDSENQSSDLPTQSQQPPPPAVTSNVEDHASFPLGLLGPNAQHILTDRAFLEKKMSVKDHKFMLFHAAMTATLLDLPNGFEDQQPAADIDKDLDARVVLSEGEDSDSLDDEYCPPDDPNAIPYRYHNHHKSNHQPQQPLKQKSVVLKEPVVDSQNGRKVTLHLDTSDNAPDLPSSLSIAHLWNRGLSSPKASIFGLPVTSAAKDTLLNSSKFAASFRAGKLAGSAEGAAGGKFRDHHHNVFQGDELLAKLAQIHMPLPDPKSVTAHLQQAQSVASKRRQRKHRREREQGFLSARGEMEGDISNMSDDEYLPMSARLPSSRHQDFDLAILSHCKEAPVHHIKPSVPSLTTIDRLYQYSSTPREPISIGPGVAISDPKSSRPSVKPRKIVGPSSRKSRGPFAPALFPAPSYIHTDAQPQPQHTNTNTTTNIPTSPQNQLKGTDDQICF